jgi:hypothetical protein
LGDRARKREARLACAEEELGERLELAALDQGIGSAELAERAQETARVIELIK